MKKTILFIVMLFSCYAYGGHIYVNDNASGLNDGTSWTDAYIDLQSALTQAIAGDSVFVGAGTYIPDATLATVSFVPDSGVSIYGGFSGAEDITIFDFSTRDFSTNETILSGDLNGDDIGFTNNTENTDVILMISNTDSATVVDGFTIRGGSGSFGGGIRLSDASPILINLKLEGNYSTGTSGAIAVNGGVLRLYNSAVINNYAESSGGAFRVNNAGIDIQNTFVSGNTCESSGGIAYLYNITNGQIINSTFVNNRAVGVFTTGGFYFNNADVAVINTIIHDNQTNVFTTGTAIPVISNSIIGGSGGSAAWTSSATDGGGNLDTNPLLVNYNSDELFNTSPAIGAGNATYGDNIGSYQQVGVPVTYTDIYVKSTASGLNDGSSWTDAYTDLQTAINAAGVYSNIYVAAGTYIPDMSDSTVSFQLKSLINLYGGFVGDEDISTYDFDLRDFQNNTTILSGDRNGDDIGFTNNTENSRRIVYANGADSCVIDGFVITGGRSESTAIGAGVYAFNSDLIIKNCLVHTNVAYWRGGGIALDECDSVIIINTTIVNNNTETFNGGGIYIENSALFSVNTIVYENYNGTSVSEIGVGTGSSLYWINSLVRGSGGSSAWSTNYGTDYGSNLDADPLFSDFANADYRIYTVSPAYGAGNTIYGQNIGWDQDGVPFPEQSVSSEILVFPSTIITTSAAFQTYTYTGINLESDVDISCVGAFEISLDSTSFTGLQNITLTPLSGSLDTAIYIRYNPVDVSDSIGYIYHTTLKAPADTVMLTGEVGVPDIILSDASLNFGTTGIQQPGTEMMFAIEGSNLLDDIAIVAPAGFEMTLESGNYSATNDTIILPYQGATQTASVYVRYNPSDTSQSGGNIYISTSYADEDSVIVTGIASLPLVNVSPVYHTFGDVVVTDTSSIASITISGMYLQGDIIVSCSDSYRVSSDFLIPESFTDSAIVSSVNYSADQTLYFIATPVNMQQGTGYAVVSTEMGYTDTILFETNILYPEILMTQTLLGFDDTEVGDTSIELSIDVEGVNLLSDIIIAAPDGFEMSLQSGVDFVPSDTLILSNNDHLVVPTTIYVRFVPTLEQSYTANIEIVTDSVDNVLVALSGTGIIIAPPELIIDPMLLDFGNVYVGEILELPMSVVGNNLTNTVNINAPSGYTVSLNSGFGHTGMLNISPVNGLIDTTVYVKFAPTAVISYNDDLLITGTDVSSSVSLSGRGAVAGIPALNVSTTTVEYGIVYIGEFAEQTVIISGTELQSDIVLNAPSGYEVSLNSTGTYVSSLTLTPVAGELSDTITIRFTPLAIVSYVGSISITGTSISEYIYLSGEGAEVPVPVLTVSPASLSFGMVTSGTVSDELQFSVVGENLSDDVTISLPSDFTGSIMSGMNYSSSIVLSPVGGIISESVYVIFSPAIDGESFGDITLTSTEVNEIVSVSGTGVAPGSPIVESTPSFIDFGISDVPVEQSLSISGINLLSNIVLSAPAGYQLSLTSGSGFVGSLELVPAAGEILQTVYVQFSPDTSGNYAGSINVTGTSLTATIDVLGEKPVPLNPQITISDTLLVFDSVRVGDRTVAQSFDLQGVDLSEAVIITPESGFEVSTQSTSGFTSGSLSISPVNGSIATTIYVRFFANATAEFDKLITIHSTEITTATVHVTGFGLPPFIYVDQDAVGANNGTSWADAYSSLAYALNFWSNGYTIVVAEGVYSPGVARTNMFNIPPGCKLYGGFGGDEVFVTESIPARDWETNATILSGDVNGDDIAGGKTDNNTKIVVFDADNGNIQNTTILDGFTISGGYSDGDGTGFYDYYASGIFVKGAYNRDCSPVISNCIVENNYGRTFGGGMAIYPSTNNTNCNPLIENVVFRNNEAGQDGGAVYVSGSVGMAAPMFSNVIFQNNISGMYGGAIYNRGACDGTCAPVYENILVCGNYADYYGGAIVNIATDEGGSCDNVGGTCSPMFINATIVNNESGYQVGGIYNSLVFGITDINFINTIVWGNNLAAQSNSGATVTFANSIVESSGGSVAWLPEVGIDGGGNFDEDPMLVDLQGCDVRLLDGSVALANGDAAYGTNIGYSQEAGIVDPPLITLNESIPEFGLVALGSTSPIYEFTVSAINLTDILEIAVPDGYEISLNPGSDFVNENPITITPQSGTVAETSIYIRLVPTMEQDYIGNVEITSVGALPKSIQLMGVGSNFNPYIYVKQDAAGIGDGSSWLDAYTDIQTALANFSAGKTIVVASGVYTPAVSDRNVSFDINEGVKIYGGFEGTEAMAQSVIDSRDFVLNETVLSGDLSGNDSGFSGNDENSLHVVRLFAESTNISSATIVDGFSIKGGNANSSVDSYNLYGGGMIIYADYGMSANPIVRNLFFENNNATSAGGGMAVTHRSTNGEVSPLMSNIRFNANTSQKGGGLLMDAGLSINYAEAYDLEFTNNSATLSGGAIYVRAFCGSVTQPYFENLLICGNYSNDGSGIYNEDVSFSGSCSGASGICSPTFVNATLTNNTGYNSEVVYNKVDLGTCSPTFINTIVYHNTNDIASVFNENGAVASFQNCIIENSGGSVAWNTSTGTDLGGNIDADPLFANADNCDVDLKEVSPALMTGNDMYGFNIGYYQGSGVSMTPEMYVSTTQLSLGDVAISEYSGIYSFEISGFDLTQEIIVYSSPDFEISTISGVDFQPMDSIIISPVGTIIDLTSVFVRFYASESRAYTGELMVVGSDIADTSYVSLYGYGIDPSSPQLILNQTHLDMSRAYVNDVSFVMGFNLSALNLTDDVMVVAPTQISLSNTYNPYVWTDTLIIPMQSATESTNVYFRFEPNDVGLFEGAIEVTSNGAVSRYVSLSAEAVPEPAFSVSATNLDFGTTEADFISDTMSVQISGSGLIDNVTLSAPEGFEFSIGTPDNFSASNNVLYEINGMVDEMVYVRLAPGSAGVFDGSIALTTMEYSTDIVTVLATAIGAPGFSGIEAIEVCQGESTAMLQFTILDEDPANVEVSAYSDDEAIIRNSSLSVAGVGDVRELIISSPNVAGYANVWLVATDSDGFADSINVPVVINGNPVVGMIVPVNEICGATSYTVDFWVDSWNGFEAFLNGMSYGAQTYFEFDQEGDYTYYVEDVITGCSADTTLSVVFPEPLSVSFIVHDEQIVENSIYSNLGYIEVQIFGGTPPYTTMYNGYEVEDPTLIQNLYSGEYDVFIRDANWCEYFETVYVGLSSGDLENGMLDINVYPNPFVNKIIVAIDADEEYSVQLLDIKGAVVSETDLTRIATLQTERLSSGEYTLIVKNATGVIVHQLKMVK